MDNIRQLFPTPTILQELLHARTTKKTAATLLQQYETCYQQFVPPKQWQSFSIPSIEWHALITQAYLQEFNYNNFLVINSFEKAVRLFPPLAFFNEHLAPYSLPELCSALLLPTYFLIIPAKTPGEINIDALLQTLQSCRLFILVGAQAEISVTATLYNEVQELIFIIDEKSKVLFNNAMHQGASTIIASLRVLLARNSIFTGLVTLQGNFFSWHRYTILLLGNNAQAQLLGNYRVRNKEQMIIETKQYHTAPYTHSTLHMHGVLYDHAQTFFKGIISIEKRAPQTDSQLINKNMLLWPYARAYSLPEMEVKTHEVRAKHGSAVGMIPEEHIMYLGSRGLSEDKGTSLIIDGFLKEPFRNNNFF